MAMNQETQTEFSVEQLEDTPKREKKKKSSARIVRNILFSVIAVIAVIVLIAALFMPVLQIYGNSMTPTLTEGNLVVSVKEHEFRTGDVIAFNYNNKILVKRVIAGSGELVDISKDGTVYVNNETIDEPYISEKALGDCDIKLPYQVPESRVFVMGDHRSVSVDSRNKSIGCVSEEQVIGKIVFRVWPLSGLGVVR